MGTLQNQDAARTCLLAMGIVCRTTWTIALTGCSRGSSISFRSSRRARAPSSLSLVSPSRNNYRAVHTFANSSLVITGGMSQRSLVEAIWHELRSGVVTTSSIFKLIAITVGRTQSWLTDGTSPVDISIFSR